MGPLLHSVDSENYIVALLALWKIHFYCLLWKIHFCLFALWKIHSVCLYCEKIHSYLFALWRVHFCFGRSEDIYCWKAAVSISVLSHLSTDANGQRGDIKWVLDYRDVKISKYKYQSMRISKYKYQSMRISKYIYISPYQKAQVKIWHFPSVWAGSFNIV